MKCPEEEMDRKIREKLTLDGRARIISAQNISLPKRPQFSHKGTFGKLLIVGGSVGFTGAPVMAAMSAQRGGTGLVYAAAAMEVYPILAQKLTEPMPFPVDSKDGKIAFSALAEISEKAASMSALLIGPGLGRSEETEKLTRTLVKETTLPLVLDADGINAFEGHIDELDGHERTLVLTPHDGEFARLGGDTSVGRLESARGFAEKHACVLVLKGHRTLAAFPDGEVFVNFTGNSGMAKGGSGDVLAGLVSSFLAQGMKAKKAVCAAVYICGAAADILAERMTEYCFTPADVIETFPEIFKTIRLE